MFNKYLAKKFGFFSQVLTVLLVLSSCTPTNPVKKSKELFDKALKAMQEGDYRKSIITLKYVIHLNPQFRDAYYQLGMSYYSIGSVQDALSSFRIYIKYNPDDLPTRVKLAEMSYIGGDYEYFFENVNVIKRIDPENIRMIELLGNYYFKKDDIPSTIYYYTKLIRRDKTNYEARLKLVNIYFKKNKLSLAKKLLEECKALAPANNITLHQISYEIYKREGNFPKILEELKILMELKPQKEKVEIMGKLAKMYFSREMYKECMLIVEDIFQINPQSAMAHYFSGKYAFFQGNYSKALRELRIAANVSYEPVDARFTMGKIYEELNQPLNAIDEYKEIAYLDSSFFEVHPILAKLYIKMGKYDFAISEAYDMLRLRLSYESPEPYYYLGLSYFHKKVYTRSIGYLKDYIKYDNSSALAAEANYLIAISSMRRIVAKSSLSKQPIDDPIMGRIIKEQKRTSLRELLKKTEKKSSSKDRRRSSPFRKKKSTREIFGESIKIDDKVKNLFIFEGLPLEDPIPYLDKAIELNPLYAEAFTLRAIVNHARGNLFLALDDAKVSLGFRLANASLCHFIMGNIYISMGNLAKAVEHLGKLKDFMPGFEATNMDVITCFDTKNPMLINKLNVAMFMAINRWYEDAIRECDMVLGENPKNTIAQYLKENIYIITPPA